MNLTNQFKLAGDVIEGRFNIYPHYIKATIHLKIDDHTPVTISYFVSRKFNPDGYNKATDIINKLSCKFPSYCYLEGKESIFKLQGTNSRLYAIGSLSTDGKRIYFNADYVEIADKNIDNFIDIRLDGQWVGRYDFLTIQNDRPLIFHIKKVNTGDDIVSCLMSYHSGYDVIEDTICNASSGLFPIYFSNTGSKIDNIDKWILEWSIICDDN